MRHGMKFVMAGSRHHYNHFICSNRLQPTEWVYLDNVKKIMGLRDILVMELSSARLHSDHEYIKHSLALMRSLHKNVTMFGEM